MSLYSKKYCDTEKSLKDNFLFTEESLQVLKGYTSAYKNFYCYEADIIEQDVLTRCGWKFIRLRASQFYANKGKTVSELLTRINNILSEEDNFNIVEPVFKLKDFDENIERREDIEEENKDEEKNNIEDKISEITKNINLTNIYINDSDKE